MMSSLFLRSILAQAQALALAQDLAVALKMAS